MGGGEEDERPTEAEIPSPGPILNLRLHELASLPIPGELLAEILLRLPTPADLVRASASCVSFRRVAADRSFLRRYRKLHGPPFLGFLVIDEYEWAVFHPAAPPHPSAPEATAADWAADFSFSFLPAPSMDWLVQDIRDGRVLLDRPPKNDTDNRYKIVFPELVVCDPLYQRYIVLPPIPPHLVAKVDNPLWKKKFRLCETFLARPFDDEEPSDVEETAFTVIWMAQCTTKLVAFAFSSSRGQWRAISCQDWSVLFAGSLSWTGLPLFFGRHYAYGCFYWVTDWKELLVLDTRRMEFSIAELPPEAKGLDRADIAIVEAGEGRLGVFVRPQNANYLIYTIRGNSCGSSTQWKSEKKITLDSGYLFVGSTGRHLFLYQCGSPLPDADAACISLDVKTFQIETVFVSNSFIQDMCAYCNFPPSLLSTPTVSCGVENRSEKEMLEQSYGAGSSHGQSSADADAGGQAEG